MLLLQGKMETPCGLYNNAAKGNGFIRTKTGELDVQVTSLFLYFEDIFLQICDAVHFYFTLLQVFYDLIFQFSI